MSFVHLHSHSHWSLLSALPKIPDMVKRAKEDGNPALALTDDGAMYGVVEFYNACKKEGIKPIIGVDFYVAVRTRHDKQPRIDNRRYRLVLLAKNQTGYRNLMKLTTLAFVEGYYYKPRIDRELIEKYSEGLVAILPQFSGELSGHLKLNNLEKAKEVYQFFHSIFGNDLYLEILHHPEIEGQMELRQKIIDFAKEVKGQLVATSDFYYLNKEDKKARDVLVSIGSMGKTFSGENDDFSMKTAEEMKEYFKDVPEAIENTLKIADKCNLEIELGVWHFPELEIEEGKTYDEKLREWAFQGLKEKGLDQKKEYVERLNYELEVIKMKGFSAYFLIVADFLKAAKEKNILTNIRGSVAGSLTTYVTGITHLDPFEFKLPFERFLNPERPSAPDIDMDFSANHRDEMIQYAMDKFGEEKVAQIGTFGTLAARGAVKDVTRVLGYEYKMGDKIAKLIPMGKQGRTMTIDQALEESPDLKKLYENNKDVKRILDMAKKIEGSARHISMHAAGVVIAPDDLNFYTPYQIDQKTGKKVTQYDMRAVGEDGAGLIKFDFLGLSQLDKHMETLRRIKKIHGIDIDLQKIPFDDPKVYKMLTAGYTSGVFQLSSEGMTKWLKELKPKNIHDINAMLALYRPGAMAFIPEYIRRKENPKLVKYVDPRMEFWLKDSYGLMVYQDDVMRMAIELAGYSWLEADKFRKAMGKKIPEVMAEQEEKFKTGCLKGGMKKEVVDKLWDEIVEFAQYGFNKAHAASYGRVSYQSAWLKANYTAEYMSAIMTLDSGDNEKIAEYIAELRKLKIPVLRPDINYSFKDFGVNKAKDTGKERDEIRFGLKTIKNLGEAISEQIVEERKKNGLYKSFEDFLVRNARHKDLNKKSLEALALSGALDSFVDRNLVLGNLEEILAFIKENRDLDPNQNSLFNLFDGGDEINHLKLKPVDGKKVVLKTGMAEDIEYTLPLTNREKLFWEKELLGVYITSHPLDKYKDKILKEGKNIASVKKNSLSGTYVLAGVMDEFRVILTKKKEKMAFGKISDLTDSLAITIFPKTFEKFQSILKPNGVYAFKGKLEKTEDSWNYVVESLKEI